MRSPDQPGSTAATVLPYHREPQFRRLWAAGLMTSLIRWLDILAFGLFAYQQTHSAFWVAAMTMLRMLPLALFGVAYGALAARLSRRAGLLIPHCAVLMTSLTLLTISLLGNLSVWHLAVASFISGAVWAGDMPMRRGYIGDVVGPSRMGQAMAADAVANTGSRLFGPGMGGLLLATGGMPAVLAAGTVLNLGVLIALLGLPKKETPRSCDSTSKPASPWAHLVAGFRVARATPRLSATLCNTIIFNLFCWPAISMVPVIGQERLRLSTEGVGYLASMDGLGSLFGASLLMGLARHVRHGLVYMGSTFLFLVMLPIFALSTQPLLSAAALMGMGASQGAFAVMQSTLVYLSAPHDRRHEAMGLMTMCIGIAPLGFLQIGWMAEHVGAPGAALASSAVGLVGLALTWKVWQPCLRDAPEIYHV